MQVNISTDLIIDQSIPYYHYTRRMTVSIITSENIKSCPVCTVQLVKKPNLAVVLCWYTMEIYHDDHLSYELIDNYSNQTSEDNRISQAVNKFVTCVNYISH